MTLAWLTWPRTVALAVALATLAAIPMLTAPWDEDEVFLVGAVSGTSPWMNSRFDAYRFSSGEPSAVAALIAKGSMPWYTAPDFKYALYRPLTSALLWLDSIAFGNTRLGYQLDALLMHALLVVAAGLLLRRVMSGNVGKGALLLFATSVVHTTATGWLTARHVLVAAVPALFGLVAHLRWREDRRRSGLPLAMALFAIALFASESGTQMLAYVVAYELCRRDEPMTARAKAIAPYVALVASYALVYKMLGRGHDYGTAFSGVRAFFTGGLPRIALHASVLLGVSVRPDNPWGFYALRWTIVAALPAIVLAAPAIRRLDEREGRRGAAWLTLGAMGALVPVMGAPLESRVLVPSSLGAAALIAAVLAAGIRSARGTRHVMRFVFIGGAALLAIVHVVIVPLELPQHYLAMVHGRERRLGTFLRAGRGDLADTDVLVVGAPHFLFGQLGGYLRERVTGQRARHWVAIADANCAHRLWRASAERVVIEPMCREGFFPYGMLEVGDGGRQLDWTVRVVERHPHARIEVAFDRPIEETAARFVTFDGFADRVVTLPAVGEEIQLPEPASWDANGVDGPSRWMHVTFGQ